MTAAWAFSGEKIELGEKLPSSKIFELLVIFVKLTFNTILLD